MNMMMRFLCVALMVHVSTAHLHGMEKGERSEDVEYSLITEAPANPLKKRMAAFFSTKIKRKIATGIGVFIVAASALAIGLGISSGGVPECNRVSWDRMKADCWTHGNHDPSTWATIECQGEILGNDSCVPVCTGSEGQYYVPVGWERDVNLRNYPNCSRPASDKFVYLICPPDEARWVKHIVEDLEDDYSCTIDTEGGVGLVIPAGHSYDAFGDDNYYYQDNVVFPPPAMESPECKEFADEARRRGKCKGPIVSDGEASKQQKTKSKHKRRS
jgi:hypothetical protein